MLNYQWNFSYLRHFKSTIFSIFPLCFIKREFIFIIINVLTGERTFFCSWYRPWVDSLLNRGSTAQTDHGSPPPERLSPRIQVGIPIRPFCHIVLHVLWNQGICDGSVFMDFIGNTQPWIIIHYILRNAIIFYDEQNKNRKITPPPITFEKLANQVIWPSLFLMIPQ